MSGLNQSIEQTFVLASPVLLAQGTTVNLAPGQVGIFDGYSYDVVTNPTYAKNKALIFAQGRPDLSHLNGLLLTGFDSASFKSKLVKGKKITGWTGKKASRGKKEIVTVGFDGADVSKNLTGVDTTDKHFYIRLTGNEITKMYSEDGIIRHYILDGNHCADCPGGTSNPEQLADEIVEKINGDKYINKYVHASKLLYSPSPNVVPTVNYTRYTVSVTDNGDAQAIAAVKVQYPLSNVTLINRNGTLSTYEIVQLASLSAPTAVSITQSVTIPECTTCPAGFTLVNSLDTYLVERSVAAGTDLTTDAAKQTYANTIGTAYQATALRSVASVTVVGGSGYTNGTYALTFAGGTGPGGATGTVTVAGGAITSVAITNGGQYLTAPTAAIPAGAGAGTGGSLTPVLSAAVTATSKFVSAEGGSAKVLIFVPEVTPDLSAIGSDTLVKLDATAAVCNPPAGTTAAWTNVETLVAYQKVYKITVADDCGDDVLAQIQAAYPNLAITLVGGTPGDGCVHVYQTTVLSEPVSTTCSIQQVKFTAPDAYKGIDWVDATVAVDPDAEAVAGVKIEDVYNKRKVDELTLDFFAHDYDGIHIEASYYNPDYNGDPCDATVWPVTKIQGIEFPHGDGLMVRKQEQRQLSLELRERSINPAVREVENYVTFSKLDKFYDEYTLSFEFDYPVFMFSERYTDRYRITFFVEEGQGKALEDAINSYIVSNNVGLDPVVL